MKVLKAETKKEGHTTWKGLLKLKPKRLILFRQSLRLTGTQKNN